MVSCFAVKNSKALINMRENDACMVCLYQKTFVTMAEMRYGLAILNSNNFVFYGQKLKWWCGTHFLREELNTFETRIEQIW